MVRAIEFDSRIPVRVNVSNNESSFCIPNNIHSCLWRRQNRLSLSDIDIPIRITTDATNWGVHQLRMIYLPLTTVLIIIPENKAGKNLTKMMTRYASIASASNKLWQLPMDKMCGTFCGATNIFYHSFDGGFQLQFESTQFNFNSNRVATKRTD